MFNFDTGQAKATECRALYTLREFGRASLRREACGVRRIPLLSERLRISECHNCGPNTDLVLNKPTRAYNAQPCDFDPQPSTLNPQHLQ